MNDEPYTIRLRNKLDPHAWRDFNSAEWDLVVIPADRPTGYEVRTGTLQQHLDDQALHLRMGLGGQRVGSPLGKPDQPA